MRNPLFLAFLGAALALAQGFTLVRALRTGRTRYRFGVVTRKGQPGRFRVFVISAWIVIAFGAGLCVWGLADAAR